MSVKTIFRAIIGTVVAMVVIALFVEYINVSTTSTIMRGTIIQSINKACDYYAQETYKTGALGNVVGNMVDIQGRAGTIAGIGKFYPGNTAKTVYNELYTSSSDFTWFMKTYKGMWKDLDMLYYGLHKSSLPGGYILTDNDKALGEEYAKFMWTPLNLYITYLDRQVLEKIARYNIVLTLSNGNPNNIYNDTGSSEYVLFKGFKIYYNNIRINSIDYVVYDLTDTNERKEAEEILNFDLSSLSANNNKLCMAFINYAVPISYEGVTPLKQIMKFVWDSTVEGLNNKSPVLGTGGTFNEFNLDTLTQNTSSGTLPIDGQIVYVHIE